MENMKSEICLNIGSGCVDVDRFLDYDFTVHLDSGYPSEFSCNRELVYSKLIDYNIDRSPMQAEQSVFCNEDVFNFLEVCPGKFNMIYAERIFEHMEYVSGEIGRLLEAINRTSSSDASLKIIVPNMILISGMLVDYEENANEMSIENQLNKKLIINTECVNIRQDPHLSIWTPRLAKEYIESEGTWVIDEIEPKIEFAQRDIYMRIHCSKNN